MAKLSYYKVGNQLLDCIEVAEYNLEHQSRNFSRNDNEVSLGVSIASKRLLRRNILHHQIFLFQTKIPIHVDSYVNFETVDSFFQQLISTSSFASKIRCFFIIKRVTLPFQGVLLLLLLLCF